MKFTHKIKYSCHPFTLIYLLFSLVFNKFTFIFLNYLLSLIHELSHILCAKSLHIQVAEIKILPFGFFARIPNLENEKISFQILILISGPLSIFISFAVLKMFHYFHLISSYGYSYGININFIIFFFNLIPIYPLDGGKLTLILLRMIFSELKARIISLILSLLILGIIAGFIFSYGDLIIFIFLFVALCQEALSLKEDYLLFLIKRLHYNPYQKIRINKKKEIFRYYNNYYLEDKILINEVKIIHYILQKRRK